MDPTAWPSPQGRRADTLRLVLSVALAAGALFAALFLLWRIREALLLGFAAVIVAVLLDAAARPMERRLKLARSLALAILGVVLLLAVAGFAWLLGAQIRQQVADLTQQLPQAITSLEQMLGIRLLPADDGQGGGGGGLSGIAAAAERLFGSLASLGSSVAGGLAALVLVVVGGFFLAADPGMYRRGVVKLFPPRRHAEVEAALDATGRALRLWLLSELMAMAIVGALVGLGTWLIGLPAPLALGIFAGLAEFVPTVGPVVGAIPALLLALTEGGTTLLWTALLFLVIQQLESNVITPMVQQRMVEIPAALLLFAVVAVGLVFGLPGVIVAAPLTVVLYVLVKQLYVRRTLGEATELPGEQHGA